jgi:protein SCO1/2
MKLVERTGSISTGVTLSRRREVTKINLRFLRVLRGFVKKKRYEFVLHGAPAAALAALIVALSVSARGDERHTMRGVVLKVDAASKTMYVSTEKVAGFMDAMVMPFTVPTVAALKDLKPGAVIEFVYVVDGAASRAENIRVTAYENLEQEPLELRRLRILSRLAASENPIKALAVGDPVPGFTLTDQHREPVTLSSLAGKVVAVTFTYLRCPNPAYCFRLASNFGQLQKRFADRMGRDLVLLTIAIDPEHDEKGELAEYAKIWTSNRNWHFLTGPVDDIRHVAGRFGVDFWKDEGLLVHSFGTVVIDRRGRLAASLEGNQFSARQLGDLVKTIMDRP